jgi:hypothetical protein
VDTPTPINSGNYTGRSLRPVPPVVPPERVAEAIVALAARPRRARRVGGLHAVAVPYAVAPDAVGRVGARLGRWFFFSAGRAADATAGGLFSTQRAPAESRGGWGEPQRGRARLAGAAVASSLAVAGATVGLARRRSRR